MIPAQYKQDIIQSGINFMRSITEAYGTDDGMKLWDTIADTLDPEIKGQILFALLTGDYSGSITLTGASPISDKVALIKALRNVANLSLKEAKDMCDMVLTGTPQKIQVNTKNRNGVLRELRDAGFNV